MVDIGASCLRAKATPEGLPLVLMLLLLLLLILLLLLLLLKSRLWAWGRVREGGPRRRAAIGEEVLRLLRVELLLMLVKGGLWRLIASVNLVHACG